MLVADEPNARDAKIVQYLNEAYGKEKQLEAALQAHIAMTTRPPYKKRLQQHLRETKNHAKQLERRIKKLGGKADLPEQVAEAVAEVAGKVAAAARGPIEAVRGTGESEKMLKNAKDEYAQEHQEIAHYSALEQLASAVGDKDTAKLAKAIRREEERMASFLGKLIPQLTKAVAKEDIPAKERSAASGARRRSTSKRRSAAAKSGGATKSASGKSTRAKSGTTSRSTRSSAAKSRTTKPRTTRARSSSSTNSGSGSSRSRASSTRSRSTTKS
jgi:ferritin-like metal-binding protein YciE